MADPAAHADLDSMPSLLSFGRRRLSRDDPLHILDLAGGIGSFAVVALKAGFSIASYNSIEVNPLARSVLRASVPLLCAEFPGHVSPASFSRFDERIPQDRQSHSAGVAAYYPGAYGDFYHRSVRRYVPRRRGPWNSRLCVLGGFAGHSDRP